MTLFVDCFRRCFFRNYFTADNRFPRTLIYTGKTAGTFRIIDFGQVAFHSDCAVGAGLNADTAGDTADGAGVHNFFALALRRAGDIYGSGYGDSAYNAFGAGSYARAAGYAPVGVDFCKSAFDADCVFGADGFAVAAAEAGVRAGFVAVQKRIAGRAGWIADVFELIRAVFRAAVAVHDSHGRFFVFEFYSQKLCDFRFLFGRGDVTVGKHRSAFGKLLCEAAATRTAAAAAVCSCKIV